MTRENGTETMPSVWLREALSALETGRPADLWLSARERIRDERGAVDAMLDRHDADAVYGFNTFFGPLDNQSLAQSEQARLLEAHLVGHAVVHDTETSRAVLAARISRSAVGATGCSAEAFDMLLSAWEDESFRLTADLSASYSSGDVVPGAWFVHSVFTDDEVPRVGDVIALINGDFVSTGLGLRALAELAVLTREVGRTAIELGAMIDLRSPAVAPLVTRVVASWGLENRATRTQIQRTVAQRDALVPLTLLLRTWHHMDEALEERLSRPSGNPLFASEEGEMRAYSQSSFLGPELSLQLAAASRAAIFATEYIVRLFSLAMEERWREQCDVLAVQPPKVMLAKVLGTASRVAELNVFTGAESGGVEDVWDYSLTEARRLLDTIAELREIIADVRRYAGLPSTADGDTDGSRSSWSAAAELARLVGAA